MLAAVTSLADPDLALLLSRPGVAVVVPAHLSRPGWRLDENGGTSLVTSRGALRGEDLSGVLVRLSRVSPEDLPHVDSRDRDYVAAEMTAFLAALLTALRCPIFNRPTPGSLAGPAWNLQHWRRAAARDGLSMCEGTEDCVPGCSLVVLDGELVSGCDVTAHVSRAACRLADLAGVRLLEVDPCRCHSLPLRASLAPRLSEQLLQALELRVAGGCAA